MDAIETLRPNRRIHAGFGQVATDNPVTLLPVPDRANLLRVVLGHHQLADLNLEANVRRQSFAVSIHGEKRVKAAINGQEVHEAPRAWVELLQRDFAGLFLYYQMSAPERFELEHMRLCENSCHQLVFCV